VETEKHKKASKLAKYINTLMSRAAYYKVQGIEGGKDAIAKIANFLGRIKKGPSGTGLKMKPFVKKALKFVGHAAIGGARSLLNSTIGAVGDIGVNGVRTLKSAKDANDANKLKVGREKVMERNASGEKDLGVSLAAAVRNQHLRQALSSGVGFVSKVGGIAKTVATGGADVLVETGLEILKDAGQAALEAGIGSLAGGGTKKTLSERQDLNLGETLAGQSATETKMLQELTKLEKYTPAKELTEEEKITEEQKIIEARAKVRGSIFKEAFDRTAGWGKRTEANTTRNQAESLDSSTFDNKYKLEQEAYQHEKEANEFREGVDTGANTLSPSEFKARSKDLKTVRAIGEDLRRSDVSFTHNLEENEGKSHSRMSLVTEKIDELGHVAIEALN
jgi:hypothetical protein